MSFDPNYLKTCGIGLLAGAVLAALPYTGLIAPLAGPAGGAAGEGPSAKASQPEESLLSKLASFGKEKLCLRIQANDRVTEKFAQIIRRKFPDGTVFKADEPQPCAPNAFVNIAAKGFDMARGEYDWFDDDYDTYHTQGHVGGVALFMPGGSKSPEMTIAINKDADELLADLAEHTAQRIASHTLDAEGEDNAPPAEDGKVCVSVVAGVEAARDMYIGALSGSGRPWYIRDGVERHQCDPDLYLAFSDATVDGPFGRAGYVTAIAVRQADSSAPGLVMGWGTGQSQASNKAIGLLLESVED